MSLIDNLINLFRIEGQVRGLRSRVESAQRYLAAQTRQVTDLETQQRELESRQLQIQARIGNLEGETQSLDERLEKLRNELNGATTNKQYTAVLTELNTAKLARSELEDRELQEMELTDSNKERLEVLAGELQERRKIQAQAEQELSNRRSEVGERLAELEAERDGAAAMIPARELKVFNELADAYDGEALASIEEIDRRHREYSCGACNMILPFQSVSQLLNSGDTLVRCTACDRILYLQEETRGALAKK